MYIPDDIFFCYGGFPCIHAIFFFLSVVDFLTRNNRIQYLLAIEKKVNIPKFPVFFNSSPMISLSSSLILHFIFHLFGKNIIKDLVS